jgi:hypothetical protein
VGPLLLELLLLELLLPPPPPPPPPQPQTTLQSIAHESICTFDRARWTMGSRLPVIRSSTAALVAKNPALKIKRCNVRTA